VFDLDDTLIDWSQMDDWLSTISEPHMAHVYEYLAAEGHAMPALDVYYQAYHETIARSWREAKKTWTGVNFTAVLADCFAACGLDTAVIDMDAVLRVFDWRVIPKVTLYEDTLAVLDALHGRGYKLGLVTNSMMPMWMRDIELREYGILDYFDARITSGDTGYMKPHPAIYERVLGLLEATAETAVFVGDRPANDIAGANAAGLTSVWMNPPHLKQELNGVTPDYEINALQELLPILAEIEKDRDWR
jgi:putative hydrolase of the HAD superfamily